MKLASKKTWVRGLFAATFALAGTLATEGQASALGAHFGGEVGVGTRSHHGFGPTVGAHFELSLIPGLFVGGYVHDTLVYPDNQPDDNEKRASFLAVGGRIRYALTVAPKLRPYAAIGLGYVYAQNPGFATNPSDLAILQKSEGTSAVRAPSGHFLELPITFGVAYEVFSHTEIDLGLSIRPGFSFKGDAYEGPAGQDPLPKPSLGLGAAVGLSFYF